MVAHNIAGKVYQTSLSISPFRVYFVVVLLFVYSFSIGQNSESDTTKTSADSKDLLASGAQDKPNEVEPDKRAVIHFRLYSDFVGLQDDQPHGLIQTEFFFTWTINKNMKKRKVVPFNNLVAPDIAVLKIDEKERSLPVLFVEAPNIETLKVLNGIDLVKYANFRLGVKLNHLKYSFGTGRIYLDAYAVHHRTQILDSTRTTPEQQFNAFGGEMNILFRAFSNNNFRLDLV